MNRKQEIVSENYSNVHSDLPTSRTIGSTSTYATVGGALAVIIQWLVTILFDIQMPEAVAMATGVVITAVGTLVGGYLAPPTVKVKTLEKVMDSEAVKVDADE